MSASRSLLFVTLTVAGYVLILAGQLAAADVDRAAIWAATHFGEAARWLINQTAPALPPGAIMAVSAMLVGTMLVAAAVALAAPPVESRPRSYDNGFGGDTSASAPAWSALLFAAVLASCTIFLCLLDPPSNIAVLTWVGSMLAGLFAFVTADRHGGISVIPTIAYGREVAIVLALAALSLAVAAHDSMSWRWSGTPDESNFFGVAKAMSDGTTSRFLLSERGVFEAHPTLSSAYQALFMWVLGPTGFAWRLSSAFALAASLPALYVLARLLWNRRVATIATLLFGTTPLAVGFAHLGYNNTQLYPVVLGSLALTVWAQRSRSAAAFYAAGCLAGLGFYTYYPARLAPLLVIWLGVCLRSFAARGARRMPLAAVLIGLALALVPVALHPQETLGRMFQFTSFTGGGVEKPADWTSAWQLISSASIADIGRHTFLALVYTVYFVGPHHFQWPPIVDPVSGPLTVVGLILCLAGVRHRNARFLAIAYVLSAILICATSHYFRPPLTRLLFLSPFAALLAAIALDRWATGLAAASGSARLGEIVAVSATTGAVIWGIVALQHNVRARYHGYGDGTTAELVRIALDRPSDTRIIYVQRVDTSMWSVDEIFAEYGMKERLTYLKGFDDRARQALAAVEPPFLAVLFLGNEEERLAAEEIVAQRFPQGRWEGSDPEQMWNLRYFEMSR